MNGSFFSSGFSLARIEKKEADTLLAHIEGQEFLDVSDVFDVYASKKVNTRSGEVIEPEFNVKIREALKQHWTDVDHPEIWSMGVNGDARKTNPFATYPSALNDFWDRFYETHLQWFSQTWGPFDHRYLLAHRYQGGQSLGFHHDLSDSTLINCIGYLGDSDYTEKDGGYLEIAECDVDQEGLPIPETIRVLDRVLPNHGVVVILDNTNPRLLHRVEPLKTHKRRYTLSCQFGYLRNVLLKKTNKS